jgi:hypothetical protein
LKGLVKPGCFVLGSAALYATALYILLPR